MPGDLPIWFVVLSLFILGSIIGSFLNVCVHRLPTHDSIIGGWRGLFHPPSRCPRCFHRIRLVDNIPVIGWLKLRGRCRSCRRSISLRYPLVEVGDFRLPGGPLVSGSGLYAGDLSPVPVLGSVWMSADAILHFRFFYHMVLLETLVVASLIDFDLKVIPDSVTVPAMIVGLAGSTLGCVYILPVWFQVPDSVRTLFDNLVGDPDAIPGWLEAFRDAPRIPAWIKDSPHLHGLAVSVTGLIAGGGMIWLVRLSGHWVLKQEAMGFGDVTLMAAIGSFLGWQQVLVIFFAAPLIAIAFGLSNWFLRGERELPYGPFLAMGALFNLCAFQFLWINHLEATFGYGPFLLLLLVIGAMLFVPMLSLSRLIRRGLGIPDLEPLDLDQWRAADQLHYHAGEHVDRFQGRWRTGPETDWPGGDAGRGQRHESDWRTGSG